MRLSFGCSRGARVWVAMGWALVPAAGSAANEPAMICPPPVEWQGTFGGDRTDALTALRQTSDGGYVLGGYSASSTGGNITSTNYGNWDYWVVRLSADGGLLWDRSFGGDQRDFLFDLIETRDGGLLLGGASYSGVSGNKEAGHVGSQAADFWFVKLDADGNKLWERNIGGTGNDLLTSLQEMSDGGILAGGSSNSGADGDKTMPGYGDHDYWLVKLDAGGNQLWDLTVGGDNWDGLETVRETRDGGLILGGESRSSVSGVKTEESLGYSDLWVVRLDTNGVVLWDRALGGDSSENGGWTEPTPDGGFIVAGTSWSDPSGERTASHYGGADFWVVRLDSEGRVIWDKSFGGTDYDSVQAMVLTADGGSIVGGDSDYSVGGSKTSGGYGSSDYWVVKLTPEGDQLWEAAYGGLDPDGLRALQSTLDGGYLLGGASSSGVRGTKTSPSFNSTDFWVIKLSAESPGDCDGDGVPNEADLCPATVHGALVDAAGCALEQRCPCDGTLADHAEYVTCVTEVAGEFVEAGLISEMGAVELVDAAVLSDCPVRPETVVRFGLTNVIRGMAAFDAPGGEGPLGITGAGPQGEDGVTVRLGEADGGVFLYPDAPVWGDFDLDWFLSEEVYGRVDGLDDILICRIEARKTYYEEYPVTLDFTPLGPASLTYQLWTEGELQSEETVAGAAGGFRIVSGARVNPRVNPFWRLEEGGVGAVIEFRREPNDYYRFEVEGPFGTGSSGGWQVSGDGRIVVRANDPSRRVEFIARAEVVAGGGVDQFSIVDARLGMFGNLHQAVGSAVFSASDHQLTILENEERTESFRGTTIELKRDQRIDLDLVPVTLTNASAALHLFAGGLITEQQDTVGQLELRNELGVLQLNAFFDQLASGAQIWVEVYANGALIGTSRATNGVRLGTFALDGGDGVPAILACGTFNHPVDQLPYFAVTLDQFATMTGQDEMVLRGNYFRVLPGGLSSRVQVMKSVTVGVEEYPALTILGERTVPVPPLLEIEVSGDEVVLSWPELNRPFQLWVSELVDGTYRQVMSEVGLLGRFNRVVLPQVGLSQFFRLESSVDP